MSELVLLTRPRADAMAARELLQRAGFRVVLVPVLEIQPLDEQLRLSRLQQILRTGHPEKIICTSRHAVFWGVPSLLKYCPEAAQRRWLAVGRATAGLLADFGIHALAPAGTSESESLLQLPELARVAGEQVLYICGEMGRNTIEKELGLRGAAVRRWEVYRRRPDLCAESGLASLEQIPDLLTAMSADSLTALNAFLPAANRSIWKQRRLLVPSERVASVARHLGFERVEVAPVTEGVWPVDYLSAQSG